MLAMLAGEAEVGEILLGAYDAIPSSAAED